MFMAAIWIVNVIFSVLENPEKGGPFRPNDLLWNARLPLGYYLVPATSLHRAARSRVGGVSPWASHRIQPA
ncbi:hypothetical protein [Mameliella sediminis]|uniref:hypothetical protein n=1 Tax=Mameliella sediminis TaxID=2836866 RepID=UPI001C45F73A|nr:hypothetical protein [Mameliella sediminis]MBY6115838.1 hypothetical protein [Antarctobacter heliothermus]MBY6145384.1 hypothetical protein [Mameliella alba]MBV7393892.1 hypothetical protein [Mameliella sediminis]MBY6162195.1 hypothetical protein [Mameliella alba]MBY6170665.1 hypothetical protein [Mameliella alba]